MAVWRLQTNTDDGNISRYCIEHHVAAVGWSLKDLSESEIRIITDFSDFRALASSHYRSFTSVCRLAEQVHNGDLIWMRSGGRYYVARVKKDSRWVFDCDARSIDAANQLTCIDWYPASAGNEYADESSVPGAVATAFIKGSTFQRIRKEGVEAYTQMLFNEVHDPIADPFFFPKPDIKLNQGSFFSMLHPSDLEDLLCMWLYSNYRYVCIPSTNKIATPKYECVLLDPASGKHIYIQVKKGKVDLDASDYHDLNGEVFLLTTEGAYLSCGQYPHVHTVDPTVIYEFALDQGNLIPEKILYWIQFLSQAENKAMDGKGIMFDTNLSYSDSDEASMLRNHSVCAFGNSMRYVRSFNKGDFVLYYSKGKGVCAIGEIISEQPNNIPDGLSHRVRPIVPSAFAVANTHPQYLSPRDIKELLHRDFYWASTIKTPFLSNEQTEILITALTAKYQ